MRHLQHLVDGPATAPVVVLGPSLGTDAGLFDRQVEALADRWRIVRYELPGHGGGARGRGHLAELPLQLRRDVRHQLPPQHPLQLTASRVRRLAVAPASIHVIRVPITPAPALAARAGIGLS